MLYRVCEEQRIALSDAMREYYNWLTPSLPLEEGAHDKKGAAKKKIDKELKELVAQLGAASVAGGQSTVGPDTPYLNALAQSLAGASSAGSSRASSHRSKSSYRRSKSRARTKSSRHRSREQSEDVSDRDGSSSSDDSGHGKHRSHRKHDSSHHHHHRSHRHH